MTFTIDTLNKTLTLHGSFEYEEFNAFRTILPKAWREDYVFLISPEMLDKIESFWTRTAAETKLITQPEYPITRNEDFCGEGCSAPFCACN